MDNEEMTDVKEEFKGVENSQDDIHGLVMEKYADIARGKSRGCMPSCCGGPATFKDIQTIGKVR